MIVSVPFAPLIVVTPEVSGVEIGRGSAVPVFSATRGITGIVEVVFFGRSFSVSSICGAGNAWSGPMGTVVAEEIRLIFGTPSTGLSCSQPFKIAKRKNERSAESLRLIVATGVCEMKSHRL